MVHLFPRLMGLSNQPLEERFSREQRGWGGLDAWCAVGLTPPDAMQALSITRDRIIAMHAFARAGAKVTKELTDLTHIDDSELSDMTPFPFDVEAFWNPLENSSTNFNRRRAAYILDRFFCDDLKPLNVALPESHAEDRHASDPSCQSCHYKLDPMAGFFRAYGRQGMRFDERSEIIFDDGASMPFVDYAADWDVIGYIRSPTDSSINAYGSSLEDLFDIIQTAPEVKACLVKRTFEYFNGAEQLVDPGYLDHLTNLFIEEADEHSSQAFRNLIRRIVTADTFQRFDRRSDQCYDFAPGTDPQLRPPCSAAYLVQKNCGQCHSGEAPQGRLDLTRWAQDAAGNNTFRHLDTSGEQIDARESMARILDRLETSDPERSMPLGQTMSARDREALYLFVDERLESLGGRP